MSESFADRVAGIVVLEGAVRISFVVATGERDERGQPRFTPSHRVIMSVEGFEKSFQTLTEAYHRIVPQTPSRQAANASPNGTRRAAKAEPIGGEHDGD